MSIETFDVFVSHASEDKETVARPVAEALASFGVRVWYDEFTLRLGDSLSRSIDKGLAQSGFGLVILSPSFFAKNWPDYELRGLTAKEIAGGKVILPIWHNVAQEDVLQFSPTLADKFAIRADRLTPSEIALKVIEVVRPDLFQQIHRRLAFLQAQKEAVVERIDPKTLSHGPPIHPNLPNELLGRIRLIRIAFIEAYEHSMEFWVEGFKRDTHPTKEISWWEHAAACYTEYIHKQKLSSKLRRSLFSLLFGLAHGSTKADLQKYIRVLPDDAYEQLQLLWQASNPIWDSDEKFPSRYDAPKDWAKFIESIDKDNFSTEPGSTTA